MNSVGKLLIFCVCLPFASIVCAADPLPPLAFPSAQGFAAPATGGRGGAIYHVTTLDDSGSGSLRDAVSRGHRFVVFDVGGYIALKSVLPISSDITLAGQTAPGQGVGTLNYEVSVSGSNNVIVRYLRFRQGNTEKQQKKCAVAIFNGKNIIFDHVSIEWGRWDCLDINKSGNITFQNCIIGQGISPQRFGCLCQSDNVTFTHNLWINNQSRNPKAKGTVQYVNNVVYNWGGAGGFVEGHSAADSYDDVVGNYFIAGPSSAKGHAFALGTPTDKIYSAGNYIDDNLNGQLDGRPITDSDLGNISVQKTPFSKLNFLRIDTANDAYAAVISGAGCSLHRDAIDQSLIDQVKSLGTQGKIIQDVGEIGGPGTINGTPSAEQTKILKEIADLKESGKVDQNGYTPAENVVNSITSDQR